MVKRGWKWLLVMGISLICLLWPSTVMTQVKLVSRLDRLVNQLEGPLPSSRYAQTPINALALTYPLAPTYYYHFAKGTASDVRPLFIEAVAVFNRTGIVKLVAGEARSHQNSLTFFSYNRKLQPSAGEFAELGEGGPTIKHRYGLPAMTVNHGRAGLNLAYPALRFRISVAIHEVGHALGLAHSESLTSIMYPLDQSQETLSAADLKALELLYGDEKG